MRLLDQSQTQGSMAKCKSMCKFGIQVSSGLGVFRCAVWCYISNNELPEQSLSLSSGTEPFAGQAVLCNCPMLTWPLSCCQHLFCLVLRKIFLLPLSAFIPQPFARLEARRSPLQRRCLARYTFVDRWGSTHTKVHLNSFFQRTWAWGWQFCWVHPGFFLQITPGNYLWPILNISDQDSCGGGFSLFWARVWLHTWGITPCRGSGWAHQLCWYLWPACWDVCHEGAQCSVLWPGDMHRLSRLEVRWENRVMLLQSLFPWDGSRRWHGCQAAAALTELSALCFRASQFVFQGFSLYPNCTTKIGVFWLGCDLKAKIDSMFRSPEHRELHLQFWSFYYLFFPHIQLIISTRCWKQFPSSET